MSVVAWVARLSNNINALKYLAMQCIKRSSTLRILEKDGKPAPRIVYKFGSQNQAIKDFLEYRAMVKKIVKEVKESDV